MNTKIIGLVVAGLVLVGAGAFVLTKDSDDGASKTAQSDENTDNSLGIDTAALEGAFELNVAGTENGQAIDVTFRVDGNGNYSSEIESDGQKVGVVFLDGITYVQDPVTSLWVSYPVDSVAAPSFDPDDFALDNDEVNDLSGDSELEDLGEQACDSGTCRVWRENPVEGEDNETALIKIDTETSRLVSVEVTNNDTNEVTTITYSYPDTVEIVAPEGATPIDVDSTL